MQNSKDYNTHITLGDMDVQIIPTDPAENYKKTGVRDANLIAYTAKVSAFGHSAYLAADLETRGGYEDRITPIVGHVDMLKAGHHGLPSSNSSAFMKALSPSMIAQTGPEWYIPDNLTESVIHGDSSWVPMMDLWSSGHIPSLIATFAPSGISYNDLSAASWGHEYGLENPRAWWFKGGRPAATTGWWKGSSGSWYYFAGKPSAEASTWVYDGGQWYWMDATGAMAAGWAQIDGQWFFLRSSGAMATGWMNSGSNWYYLSGSGAMATGWLYDVGSWYYLDATTGAMATGWSQVDGKWYFLRSSGAMATGWMNSGSNWYYLSGSGAMATGWILDGGAWYYLGDTGAMATGTQEIDGRSSTFSLSGRWLGYAS